MRLCSLRTVSIQLRTDRSKFPTEHRRQKFWETTDLHLGGKSGATFFLTHDRRFLIKKITRSDVKTLMLKAVHKRMMDHFARRFWDGQPSLLAQIYGAFRVEHRSGRLGPRVSDHYIVT